MMKRKREKKSDCVYRQLLLLLTFPVADLSVKSFKEYKDTSPTLDVTLRVDADEIFTPRVTDAICKTSTKSD